MTFSLPESVGMQNLTAIGKGADLLDANGHLQPRPCAEYDALSYEDLRLFCHWNARYLLVTTELVVWLKALIGDRSALEIGAGCGDLGRAVGIKMTDSYQQTWPDVKKYYDLTKQPIIKYGADVQERDANSAVKKWTPDVVVGAWVTHWIDPHLPPPEGGGNMYGIKEDEILKHCKYYVLIGAEGIHKYKKIMALPHKVMDAPFVRSRRTDNRIWIWKGEK